MDNEGEMVDLSSRALETFRANRQIVAPRQGTPLAQCPSNLDLNNPRDKAMLLKGSGPGELEVKEDAPLRMVVTRWMMTPDSRPDDKTGEIHEFVWCVLFQADGKHFRTTAAHGPFRLSAMFQLYSPEEWDTGIPVIVTVRKSKRGTTYHDIGIDMERL